MPGRCEYSPKTIGLMLSVGLLVAGLSEKSFEEAHAVGAARVCSIDGLPEYSNPHDLVSSFYAQLNWECGNESRASWATQLMDHYFSSRFVGHGGKDNHDYSYSDFRSTVGDQFELNPNVQLRVKHFFGDENTMVIHVALENPGARHLYEYLALYKVVNGEIRERWAYGDRNFP